MNYCSYRLDWGAFRDGKFYSKDLTVDGQMDTPWNDKTHLNWKELHNFIHDFDGAFTYLTTLLDNAKNPNTIAYFGCRGFKTSKELWDKYEDYKKFYREEILEQ